MNRVVRVDKSLISGGTEEWYVTTEDESGQQTRIKVSEEVGRRFQADLQAQSGQGSQQVLTETYPI